MSIDQSKHSLFGASKVAADVLVQEYGRYFGMPTACFRGGCLTGPDHSGAKLHGFLAYLMSARPPARSTRSSATKASRSATTSTASTSVAAFDEFYRAPRAGEVYNIGGTRYSNCSMLEAIELCERSPAASSTGLIRRTTGSATTSGTSPTRRNFEHALSQLEPAVRSSQSPAESTKERRALGGRNARSAGYDGRLLDRHPGV